MTDVTEVHELKDTLSADYFVPGHDERETTSLFTRTKKLLIEREGGRCFITNMTAEELGAPLQAHHHPVERCFATAWDWPRFADDCKAGKWGPYAQAFDWDSFLSAQPFDPYRFVDDMTVNGMLLGAGQHIGKDEGLHRLPFPVWLFTKYAVEGWKFSPTEVIHHDPEHL
jgi:hypothetical protein